MKKILFALIIVSIGSLFLLTSGKREKSDVSVLENTPTEDLFKDFSEKRDESLDADELLETTQGLFPPQKASPSPIGEDNAGEEESATDLLANHQASTKIFSNGENEAKNLTRAETGTEIDDFVEEEPIILGDPERGFAPIGSGSSTETARALPSPSPSPSPSPTLLIDNDQARGYALLHLMQPQARESVNLQIQNIIDANIKKVYLSVLVDGSFSWDPGFFLETVRRLNEEERELTLVAYLSNGPTMRRFDNTPSTAAFNQIDPAVFRELIQRDPVTRTRFEAIARRMIPIFSENIALNDNNRNIAIVMLEDNLNVQSYRAMREIARGVLQGLAEFYRNPCDCEQGAEGITDTDPQGDRLEFHVPEDIPQLRRNDGYTLDGAGFTFDFERNVRGISQAQVLRHLQETRSQQVAYFGLWRFDRQGLGQGTLEDSLVPFDQREYTIPTAQQLAGERALMRFGFEETTTTQ